MDAQVLRCPTRRERDQYGDRDQSHACTVSLIQGLDKRDRPPNRNQHDSDKRDQKQQGYGEMNPVLGGVHHRSENGQQQPGTDVVNRRAWDGHRPEAGSKQIPLFQDSGEHRESSDTHCRSHEQSKRRKSDAGTGKLRIERRGQTHAQSEWQHNTEIADQHNGSALFQHVCEINFEADHKHEEQKSKLAQDCEGDHQEGGR